MVLAAHILAALSCLALIWQFATLLPVVPDQLVSQFGFDGSPRYASNKTAYVLIIAGVAGSMLAVYLLAGLTRRLPDKLINNRAHDAWFKPEWRARIVDWTIGYLRLMLALSLSFIVGVNGLVLEANRVNPPRLPSIFFVLLGCYLLAIFAVILRLITRFRKSPTS